MLSSRVKPLVVRLITPVAKSFLAMGLTPNGVTFIGSAGVVSSAFYFYPRGELFSGTLVICLFALSDLFDGTMARISGTGGTKWGGFLDSTLDRVTDACILIALGIYLVKEESDLLIPTSLALLFGFLVPYVRAKAESLNIECSVGIAERTERLILLLTGIGLSGLDIPFVLPIALWLVVILGAITTVQRVLVVRASL